MFASPSIFQFDVEKLLSPISPDKPAGNSLRYDPIYDHIQMLRKEDDESLPQGVWEAEPKRADWPAVESACMDVLETRSKDLQVAAWLLEAWLHLHGFAGVAEGFRAMHALSDAFWDHLYPQIQSGDPEYRIAPILWLNDRLPARLKLIPLTTPESSDVPVCTLADWERASQQTHARASVDGRPNVEGPTLAQLQQSAILTPTDRLVAKAGEVQKILAHCSELDQLLDQKLGREAPGLMPIRSVTEQCLVLMNAMLRDRIPAPEPNEAPHWDQIPAYPPPLNENLMYIPEPGRVRDRAEAYQMLADAAEFLARTEPHSPTPYLVRRAISWGAMSLDQVLSELVRNQAELTEIYRLLDISPLPPEKK